MNYVNISLEKIVYINNHNQTTHAQDAIKIRRYENGFTKIVFPFLDEISLFLSNTNIDKYGGTYRLERKN
jgi:hypothetical protein